MRRTRQTSSRRTRRWRGLAAAGIVVMLVAGVLSGAALLRRIMPDGPPAGDDRATAALVDGRLVITNPDGSVTIIDVSAAGPLDQTRATVLLASDGIYLADRAAGTIARLDPVDGSLVEPVWTAPAPIVDAVVDGTDTLWVLCEDELHSLTWTEAGLAPAREPVAIPGAGAESGLAWHSQGVTVILDEAQHAWRVGTSIDGNLPLPDRCPGLTIPVFAPAYNVPVACDGTLMTIGPDAAIVLDLRPYGCATPGATAGLKAHAVVTCQGTGKALLFDVESTDAPREIVLGTSGDVLLTYGQGRVSLSLPGHGTAILEWDGTLSGAPSGLAGGIESPTGSPSSSQPPGGPPEEPDLRVDPEPPADPPPPPRDGEDVIASISGPHDVQGATYNYTPQPPSPPTECQIDPYAYYPPGYLEALAAYCYGYYYPTPVTYTVTEVHRQYTAHLMLPDSWTGFAATCSLIVNGAADPIDPRPFDCQDDADVLVGYGDGTTWNVAVKACAASGNPCVTSKAEPITTVASSTCYSSASGTTCT